MEPVLIRPMQQKDLDSVVEVHMTSFPVAFLTFLGPRFLKLFYRELLASPDHVALVAEDELCRLVGFVAGVRQQAGFFGRLVKRRLPAFMFASLSAAARRPTVVPRLLRALNQDRAAARAASEASLMSLAVAPQAMGRGIGSRLVTEFLRAMHAAGSPAVSLTTDANDNDHVNDFYQRLGFTTSQTYVTPEGRRMNEYVIDLSRWRPALELA